MEKSKAARYINRDDSLPLSIAQLPVILLPFHTASSENQHQGCSCAHHHCCGRCHSRRRHRQNDRYRRNSTSVETYTVDVGSPFRSAKRYLKKDRVIIDRATWRQLDPLEKLVRNSLKGHSHPVDLQITQQSTNPKSFCVRVGLRCG